MAVSENDLIIGPVTLAMGVTLISLDFFMENEAWLEVYKTGSEVALILDTDYTVLGEGTETGSVTLTVAADGIDSYSVYYVVPLERNSDMQLRGEFKSGPFNTEFDRAWQAMQGMKTTLSRSLQSSRTSPALPPVTFGAGDFDDRAMIFNSDSTAIVPGPTASEIAAAEGYAEAAAASAALAAPINWKFGWLTSTAYLKDDGVRFDGSSYICITNHTSGSFATDLAAGKWDLMAEKGLDGGGGASVATRNMFLGVHFKSQNDTTLVYSTSLDGIHFTTVNHETLNSVGIPLEQRDPAAAYFEGKWYTFGTGSDEGSHDFVVYRGVDIPMAKKHQIPMVGGPYKSATIPMPGGVEPANQIWAPEPFIWNSTLYVLIAIQFGADYVDGYGDTVGHMKMYISELTDVDNLVFGTPVAVNFGVDDALSLIDMSIYDGGATLYAAVKDDDDKNIRFYTASTLTGLWTHTQTINDPQRSLEAPCLTPFTYFDTVDDVLKTGLRCYVDNNRTGISHATPNVLAGHSFHYDTVGEVGTSFDATQHKTYFNQGARHGTVLNVSTLSEEAQTSLTRFISRGGPSRSNLGESIPLVAGAQTIEPKEGATYFVDGTTKATVTLVQGSADTFNFAVYSKNTLCGIEVLETSAVAGPIRIGFDDKGDRIAPMRRKDDAGQYYMVGGPRDTVNKNYPLIQEVYGIAHRGRSATAPENTLPSFALAVSDGMEYMEADLRLTSDGVWVLLHDVDVDRTSDGTGNIDSMTLAAAKLLDFGTWKDVAYAGTTIPTAEEFFKFCFRQGVTPIVETKLNATQGQIDTLVDLAIECGIGDAIIYTSFDTIDMEKVILKKPSARIGLISTTMSTARIEDAIALKTSSNHVSMLSGHATITAVLAQEALESDIEVIAWTVDTSGLVEPLTELGVSGIITNSLDIPTILEGIDGTTSGGGGGLTNWEETGTSLNPVVDGGALGTATKGVREVAFQARDVVGAAGASPLALFQAQSGGLRLAPIGTTGDNEGVDAGWHHRADETTTTSGTYVWDRTNGQGINFTLPLTGALTIDVTDMKRGEFVYIFFASGNGQTALYDTTTTNVVSNFLSMAGALPQFITVWKIDNVYTTVTNTSALSIPLLKA